MWARPLSTGIIRQPCHHPASGLTLKTGVQMFLLPSRSEALPACPGAGLFKACPFSVSAYRTIVSRFKSEQRTTGILHVIRTPFRPMRAELPWQNAVRAVYRHQYCHYLPVIPSPLKGPACTLVPPAAVYLANGLELPNNSVKSFGASGAAAAIAAFI